MSDAAGEQADSLKLLRLPQTFLGPLALRDIKKCANRAGAAALQVQKRNGAADYVGSSSILEDQLQFSVNGLPGRGGLLERQFFRRNFPSVLHYPRESRFRRRFRKVAAGRHAEQLICAAIAQNVAAVRIPRNEHRDWDRVHDRTQFMCAGAFFAVSGAQGVFGLALLANIGHGGEPADHVPVAIAHGHRQSQERADDPVRAAYRKHGFERLSGRQRMPPACQGVGGFLRGIERGKPTPLSRLFGSQAGVIAPAPV